jgi:cell division protein FtsQ
VQPLSRLRDPAPSRLAYRLNRLMLTPAFRFFLRAGLPFSVVALAVTIYLADDDRREALAEGAAEMRRQIEQRPEFQVRLMAIDGASDGVDAELREILPLDLPVSSFDLDLEAIRKKAEELDAVASASARIRSGGVLQLDVVEREPAVVWRGRKGLELLDTSGHRVSAVAHRTERPDLPLLAGEGASAAVPEAMAILSVAELITPRIRGILRVGERRWDLVLDRDQRILLPETEAVAALERVIAMDEVHDLLSRDVTVVDVRNPKRPTIRIGFAALQAFRDASLMRPGAN